MEDDLRPVGRPGRREVQSPGRQLPKTRAVRGNRVEVARGSGGVAAREHDRAAVGRPVRRLVCEARGRHRDPHRSRPVGADRVDRVSRDVGDPGPVRRPGRVGREFARQPVEARSVDVDDPDREARIGRARAGEGEPASVGRPRRLPVVESRCRGRRDLRLPAAVRVHHVDPGATGSVARVGDSRPVGRPGGALLDRRGPREAFGVAPVGRGGIQLPGRGAVPGAREREPPVRARCGRTGADGQHERCGGSGKKQRERACGHRDPLGEAWPRRRSLQMAALW